MNNKYLSYQLTDFVNDSDFVRWVKKPTQENNVFWNQFCIEYPQKKEVIDEARKAILGLSKNIDNPDPLLVEEIWSEINTKINHNGKKTSVIPLWKRLVSVAAVLLIICGLGFWFTLNKVKTGEYPITYQSMKTSAGSSLTEIVNTTDSDMSITLPDSSQVTLSKSGKISYAINDTSQNRSVFLSGEAFFNVKKDANHPFFVYTNGLVTRVVGTSFRIKGLDNDSLVSVSVRTGKVLVFSSGESDHNEREEILLKPNEKVSYDRSLKKMELTLADSPAIVLPPADLKAYKFNNTPVNEILKAIQKAYNIEIEYNMEDFSNCRLTIEITENSSLFEQLDIISEALGASYSLQKNKIILNGKPCN